MMAPFGMVQGSAPAFQFDAVSKAKTTVDTQAVLVLFCVKLSGEDLSRYSSTCQKTVKIVDVPCTPASALIQQPATSITFWILLEQEMMWWQWHQLDHMQIICT